MQLASSPALLLGGEGRTTPPNLPKGQGLEPCLERGLKNVKDGSPYRRTKKNQIKNVPIKFIPATLPGCFFIIPPYRGILLKKNVPSHSMRNSCYFLLFSILPLVSCSPGVKTTNTTGKNFYYKPVYLTVPALEADTALYREIREAFTSRNIKLVSKEEMKILNEQEAERAGKKVFTRDAQFSNAEEMQKALGLAHQYASNMLSVSVKLEKQNDSMVLSTASWTNIPFPPNFSRPFTAHKREIRLSGIPAAIKKDIRSLADSILYSGDLQ
jgi:hypothetical protein